MSVKISQMPPAQAMSNLDLIPVVQNGINAVVRAGLFAVFIFPETFGAKGDNATDDTTAIQNAINAAPTGATIFFGTHIYRYVALTVNKPLRLVGSGMSPAATTLRTTSSTAGGITITTSGQVEVSEMTMDSSVVQTAGAFITVGTNIVANGLSLFKRIEFISPFVGINFISAALFTVENCYFPTPVSIGINVQDVSTPDAGDSTITGCTFDSGAPNTRIAINQASSGGLRIINNKFLGGAFHILAQMVGQTSILIITGNSMEAAGAANIALNGVNPTTFSKVIISGNQFSINPLASGISVTDPGYSFLDDMSVGDNSFNLAATATGINLGRGIRVSIFPNSFIGNGAGSVGITFSVNATTVVWPQNMPNVGTRYNGNISTTTFISGGLEQSGTSTSAATATGLGAVFVGPVTTVVFPVAFPKTPTLLTLKSTEVGGGIGVLLVDGSLSATQFQYKAVGSAVGSTPKIQWEASGG